MVICFLDAHVRVVNRVLTARFVFPIFIVTVACPTRHGTRE